MKLKKITYKAIKNSNIIVNYKNCKKFIKIKEAEAINCLTVEANINKIQIFLKRNKYFNTFKKDMQNLNPLVFGNMKQRIL